MRKPDKKYSFGVVWELPSIRVWADTRTGHKRIELAIDDGDDPGDYAATGITLDEARDLRDCLDAAIAYAQGENK